MKNLFKSNRIYRLFIPFIFGLFILVSCEDSPPNDYLKKYYVEAYIFVGEPIRNIKLMTTQAVTDSFDYQNSFIKDAQVIIKQESNTYVLNYDYEKNTGYYYSDTNVKIQSFKDYSLEITLKDGSYITASTKTPGITQWNGTFPTSISYPKDSIKLPPLDSVKLSWNPVPNTQFYMISLKCLDTLEYGKYLSPATDEKNRRIERPWTRSGMENVETTRYGFVPVNNSPVVWNFFKWFGKTKIKIFVPDYFFLRYFIQYQLKNSYDPLLTNITGDGIGIFASASYIEREVFVIKNQP